LLMAIFAGYFMRRDHVQEELDLNNKAFGLWRIANNFIAPIAILAIFLYLVNIIK
jgi:NSS family neurotransmitter:Na+ symporter